uniref:Carbohydrate sulfotransferase n=1 Tax=Dicentrarchus labrax TaxID=13489 RepID=A0A8C4DYV1_DICLA
MQVFKESVCLCVVGPSGDGQLSCCRADRRRRCCNSSVGSKQPVTKRHRKLLLKSSVAASSAPAGRQERQQQLARTQESRRRLLASVCTKYQPGVTEWRVSQRQVSRVYVEDRSQLLYCEVPKAGCSNWKRVLMVLGGSATSTQDIPHDAAHYGNHLRRLESYDRAGITERLRSYTKVLFVREPFERLVSAFRDKFESPNSYYHPVFGRPIISRYRANATRTCCWSLRATETSLNSYYQPLFDARSSPNTALTDLHLRFYSPSFFFQVLSL